LPKGFLAKRLLEGVKEVYAREYLNKLIKGLHEINNGLELICRICEATINLDKYMVCKDYLVIGAYRIMPEKSRV